MDDPVSGRLAADFERLLGGSDAAVELGSGHRRPLPARGSAQFEALLEAFGALPAAVDAMASDVVRGSGRRFAHYLGKEVRP